jgi:hypothetical protein
MDKATMELREEDEIFSELGRDEEEDMVDIPEDEGGPEAADVDPLDLSEGFRAGLRVREIDVDEDTEGDDTVEIEDTAPLTATYVPDPPEAYVHGDEVELPLDQMLVTGQTEHAAPGEVL